MKCKCKNKPTADFSGDEGHSHLAGAARTGCGGKTETFLCVSAGNLGSLPACSSSPHPLKSHPSCPEAATSLALVLVLAPFSGYSLSKPQIILQWKCNQLETSFFYFTHPTHSRLSVRYREAHALIFCYLSMYISFSIRVSSPHLYSLVLVSSVNSNLPNHDSSAPNSPLLRSLL